MILFELFPTCVAQYKLDRDFTEEEVKTFHSVNEMEQNLGNLISLDKNVLDIVGLKEIKKFILKSVSDYISEIYKPKNKIDSYITNSWINYINTGQYHHKHNHPNSFISGVFYLKASPGQDRIEFYSDRYNQVQIQSEEYNRINSEKYFIGVSSGDLLLFPSRLSHEVEPSLNSEPRISLSFNTFVRGYLGGYESMSELNLL